MMVFINCHPDGGTFNLTKLQMKTKVLQNVIRHFIFAYYCALYQGSEQLMKHIKDRFCNTFDNVDCIIKTRKCKLCIGHPTIACKQYAEPDTNVKTLKQVEVMERFRCYISNDIH